MSDQYEQYKGYIVEDFIPVMEKVTSEMFPAMTGSKDIQFKGYELKDKYNTSNDLNSYTKMISNKIHGIFGFHSDKDFVTSCFGAAGIRGVATGKLDEFANSYHVEMMNQLYNRSKFYLNELGYKFELYPCEQIQGKDKVIVGNIDLSAIFVRITVNGMNVYISFCFFPPKILPQVVYKDYYAVPVFSLMEHKPLLFDVFLYLKVNDKLIKIVSNNKSLDTKFKEKLLNHQYDLLYIHKDELPFYEEYVKNDIVEKIKRAREAGTTDGTQIVLFDYTVQMQELQSAVKNLFKAMVNNPDMGKNLVERCTEIIQGSIEIMCKESNLFKRLNEVAMKFGKDNPHYINVSTFAMMFAIALEITDHAALKDIGIAATLHDIGKIRMPESAREKNPIMMNADEYEEYKKHPQYSKEMLIESNAHISDLAFRLICEHHESFYGNGFPQALSQHQIHPYSQIVSIADKFDNLIAGFSAVKGMSPKEAMDKILADNTIDESKASFNYEVITALYKNLMG